jgi:Fe-S cluster biogenesis protein NfuA
MTTDNLRDRVQQTLRAEIAPALGFGGDDIEVLDVSDGIASVRLSGACASCGGGIAVVVAMLEQELRLRVPEVEFIEAVA